MKFTDEFLNYQKNENLNIISAESILDEYGDEVFMDSYKTPYLIKYHVREIMKRVTCPEKNKPTGIGLLVNGRHEADVVGKENEGTLLEEVPKIQIYELSGEEFPLLLWAHPQQIGGEGHRLLTPSDELLKDSALADVIGINCERCCSAGREMYLLLYLGERLLYHL